MACVGLAFVWRWCVGGPRPYCGQPMGSSQVVFFEGLFQKEQMGPGAASHGPHRSWFAGTSHPC